MKVATGWAVVEDGVINVRTVSPTRRAATINWLCVEAHHLVYGHFSDALIEQMWQDEVLAIGARRAVEVVEVNIELKARRR